MSLNIGVIPLQLNTKPFLEGVLLKLVVPVPDDAEQLQDGLSDVKVAAMQMAHIRSTDKKCHPGYEV